MRLPSALFAMLLLATTACKKPAVDLPAPSRPAVHHRTYNNATAGQGQTLSIDLDEDGDRDIAFARLLIGDPIANADKHWFVANGYFNTFFPVNPQEEVPVLEKGASVASFSYPGYNWYNAPAIILAEKVVTTTKPSYWQGLWKDARNKYLPLYLKKGNNIYFGWVEISFDQAGEKIILIQSAVSVEPNKGVVTGKTS